MDINGGRAVKFIDKTLQIHPKKCHPLKFESPICYWKSKETREAGKINPEIVIYT